MPQNDWISGPIWRELVAFTGESFPSSGNSRALALYDRTESLLREHPRNVDFICSLSPSQHYSLRIIQEWWSCSIEEDEWFTQNRDRSKALEVLQLGPALDNVPPIVVQTLLHIGPIMPKVSTYRLEIFRLFHMEFDPEDGDGQEEKKILGFLQQQRERSAFYASVQRMTFNMHLKQGDEDSVRSLGHKRDSLSSRIKGTMGACIEACPWLRFRKGRDGYPFYLWDTQRQSTVVVDDMKEVPEYICVSHTWGRWRDRAKPNLSLPNVPWLVPQNTKFRVEDLPDRLGTAFPGQYVWFDLLCIPQDRSERALQEISRQAQIFGNATTVVAWLNDIEDWAGLRHTIDWLSMYCLRNRGNGEEVLPEIDENLRTGLVVNEKLADEYPSTPCGWLTSLWTLQEACLRPDMVLCNKDFELLTVRNDTIVTLDSLAALLNYSIGFYSQGPFETLVNRHRAPEQLEIGSVVEYERLNAPDSNRTRRVLGSLPPNATGLIELYDAFVMSGMNKLFTISPASVFHLGQHRKCTSSRAEAIMSVVGATDWYKSHVETYKTSPSEDELVMGYYPAAFLNEAACKTGATFYATVASDLGNLSSVVDMEDGAWNLLDTSKAIGSLLPFTTGGTTLLPQEHDPTDSKDHPSISTWTILPSGKVYIREAAILSSTVGNFPGDLQASVRVPGILTTAQEQINLHDWIRSFRIASSTNYAISLYQPTKRIQWGLILKQVGNENCLVKIGTFYTDALTVEEVPSQTVDWIIL